MQPIAATKEKIRIRKKRICVNETNRQQQHERESKVVKAKKL